MTEDRWKRARPVALLMEPSADDVQTVDHIPIWNKDFGERFEAMMGSYGFRISDMERHLYLDASILPPVSPSWKIRKEKTDYACHISNSLLLYQPKFVVTHMGAPIVNVHVSVQRHYTSYLIESIAGWKERIVINDMMAKTLPLPPEILSHIIAFAAI